MDYQFLIIKVPELDNDTFFVPINNYGELKNDRGYTKIQIDEFIKFKTKKENG
jgi:hypothetical protein